MWVEPRIEVRPHSVSRESARPLIRDARAYKSDCISLISFSVRLASVIFCSSRAISFSLTGISSFCRHTRDSSLSVKLSPGWAAINSISSGDRRIVFRMSFDKVYHLHREPGPMKRAWFFSGGRADQRGGAMVISQRYPPARPNFSCQYVLLKT